MAKSDMQLLGGMLRERKKASRMRTSEITQASGLSRPTVEAILNGKNAKFDNVVAVCRIMGIRIMFMTEREYEAITRTTGR